MIARKVLFPTDFSDTGRHALELATSLARDGGGSLVIIHVEEPPLAYGGGELFYVEEVDREELKRKLASVVPTDAAVPCTHKLLVGDPADAIIQVAETEEVDLIVMGTHGRRGLTRLLMGSVAEAVVRRATCPVLTVKQPAEVPAGAT
jgi:nucleotide-binding universal stress UspA family protein